MITTEDVTADPHPDEFGADAGALHAGGLAYDVDGDGVLDTQVFETDDATIVVADTDGDGESDHLTIVGTDGEYAAWEFHRDPDGAERWERVDVGDLGE